MQLRKQAEVTSKVLVCFWLSTWVISAWVFISLFFKMYLFNILLCMYDTFHNKTCFNKSKVLWLLVSEVTGSSMADHLPVLTGLPLLPFSTWNSPQGSWIWLLQIFWIQKLIWVNEILRSFKQLMTWSWSLLMKRWGGHRRWEQVYSIQVKKAFTVLLWLMIKLKLTTTVNSTKYTEEALGCEGTGNLSCVENIYICMCVCREGAKRIKRSVRVRQIIIHKLV